MTEEIERLIIERRSTEDIQKVALMQGMLTPPRATACARPPWARPRLEEIFRVVA